MTQPKPIFVEEFGVEDLVVRVFAFEEEGLTGQKEGKLFGFPVFKDGTLIRVIEVEWHDFEGLGGRTFFLEESFKSGGHVTYENYGQRRPTLEELLPKVEAIVKAPPAF
jgi:hypothetical protein